MTSRPRWTDPDLEPVSFRLMMEGDLPEVFAIEAEAFLQPWSETDFYDVLDDADNVALVAQRGEDVVGYILTAWKDGWVRILSCVVAAGHRRQGLGARMIAPLVEARRLGHYKGLVVNLSERNLAGQLFFRSCGFRAVRTLRGYLFDDRDVYVMQHAEETVPEETEIYTFPQDELMPCWEAKHA